MARKASSTISQEELYPQTDEAVRPDVEDARLLDLDVEQESPFLRAQKRVSVRRAKLPKKTAVRLAWAALALLLLFFAGSAALAAYRYGEHSWRFRIDSSDDLEIEGLGNVTRAQVIEVMGGDIGRNVFFVPLSEREKQLEQIPWVESASVMRFVPNRLRIEIHERTPVAFARVGSKIFLTDANGVLMELPVTGKKKFSFPVILGMSLNEAQSMRASRMKLFNQLISDLDASGGHYSQNLSEIDLSDPEDVKVLADDSHGEVLVHLGSSDFLDRFKIYVSHVQEWRQQFPRLDSVDLRYEHQIILNPDLQGTAKQPPLTPHAVRAAMNAGVKPAALVSHEQVKAPAVPAASTPPAKTAGSKKMSVKWHKKVGPKKASGRVKATALKTGVPNPTSKSTSPATVSTTKLSKPSPGIPREQQ